MHAAPPRPQGCGASQALGAGAEMKAHPGWITLFSSSTHCPLTSKDFGPTGTSVVSSQSPLPCLCSRSHPQAVCPLAVTAQGRVQSLSWGRVVLALHALGPCPADSLVF